MLEDGFSKLTMHNAKHHISFAHYICNVHVTRVSTAVNDTIHIEIQMVKFWQQRRVRNDLIDFCVALTDPAIKLLNKKTRSANNVVLEGWLRNDSFQSF